MRSTPIDGVCQRFTTIPRRFGTFGKVDGQLTLIGGWHPYLAALDSNRRYAVSDMDWADSVEPLD